MRTECLPSNVSCPMYEYYHLVCLESELLYFSFRIEGNYLSYLSFHCIITQPDCSHVLVHAGSDLIVILPLTQKSDLCLLIAKQNSGVRPLVHFKSYSSYAKLQPEICEIKTQQFYNALKWDSVLLAGISVWISVWKMTHYLISGGVWLTG